MKFHFKNILLLCLFINTLMSEELEKVSVQLKWKYQFQFAGFIAAKEKGFYKDLGLDVELLEYTNKTNTLKDMMKGKTQFGVSDSALILEALKGIPVVGMMAIYQESPYVLMSLKSSNIKTIKDLDGKRIAIYDDINSAAIKSMLKINNIHFIQKPIDEKLRKLKNKEIDAAISYLSNEPYIAEEMGLNVNTFNPSDDGLERYGDILFTLKSTVKNNPILVEKMQKATKKGFEYAFTHIDEMISIIHSKYNTLQKSKNALKYEAETLLKMSRFDDNYGELNEAKVESIAYIYSYSDTVKYDKNNLAQFIYKVNSNELTSSELKWLEEDNIVKIRVANYPPYQMNINGKFEGISVDYIEKILRKYNIKYKFISYKEIGSLSDALESIRDKKGIDLLLSLQNTPKRKKDMLFTNKYSSSPWVIFTREDSDFLSGIDALSNKTVAVEDKFVIHKLLESKYPKINLEIMKDINPTISSMKALSQGEVDSYIGNLTVGSYIIKSYSLNNIKVAAPSPFGKHEHAMAIRDDWPALVSIINRELKALSIRDKDEINNKYLSMRYEYGFSFWDIIKWISIVIIILGTVVVLIFKANRTLEKKIAIEIEKNTKQQIIIMHQSKLTQMGEMIENIAHQWRQPLSQINSSVLLMDMALSKKNVEYNVIEDKLLEIESLTSYMSKTIDNFKNFFNPNKEKNIITIKDSFEKSCDILKGMFQKYHIAVEIDIDEKLICKCHLDELQQVILTLLNNAIDALIIKTITFPQIFVKAYKKENNIIITIQDNALGIDNNIINKIFEPYFTTKHQSQGTGLGLYIAKMITENGLSGTLNVENKLDGACFKLVLPIGKVE